MMVMLAIASTVVELMFAAKIPAWRKGAHKLKWLNMVISIALSFILGLAFGAAGLIALGAAMLSTVLSIPGYAFLNWNYDSKQAQRNGGNMIQHIYKKWTQAFKDLAKIFYAIIRVITFPVWGTRVLINKYNTIKTRLARA